MGSIVMHLCVAHEANKVLKLDNNKFMVGSIAPDIHKISGGSRIDSHYIKKYEIDGKTYELPDLDAFIKEHGTQIKDDAFIAGYYAHLIADRIWYKEVSCKYTEMEGEDFVKVIGKENPLPYDEYRRQIYDDYTTINDFLLQKYNVDTDYLYNVAVLNVDRADFQKMLEKNLESKGYEVDENVQLNILQMDDILEWIEKSKDEIIKEISKYL